ncbi:Type I restriction-modification system, specificity subunit S [Acetobacter malorum]|uniref:Type I restriction-modification system, specificity subunit S n=1 Tax=Acetobacter malorum TaxID=178901 RepID=A0A087PQG2_9PROT|nr:restriction endonuclease subunit S [Acetobacter malorum]KFL89615.1 Type I restriction-modification system, specificity subunit S [Acetobacter malorum]OAG77380.1 Type I restriction-modification system, specificity subunit S [Acetobacter malorum]
MSFPKYPAYKDSGVEWIGEIPEGWEVTPIKRQAHLHTEKTTKSVFTVALENIESGTGKFIITENQFQGDGIGFQVDDILFGKLRPYLAKVWLANCYGEAIGDFHVIRSDKCNAHFLQWLLLSIEIISQIDGSTFGAKMPRASWEFIGQLNIPIPSLPEQKAIAIFLDRECKKIDALIEEQERLIALLQEKRQAVITHAVTKGLEPNVSMQDSGIKWIGEVPQTYRIIRLSLLFNIISSGTTPTTDNESFYDGNIAWVTTGELKEKGISETTKNITELAFSHFPALRLYPPNTLLIAMYGATIGRLGWLEVAAATNQACCALADSHQVEMKFIFYTLLAAKQSLVLLSSGGGQPNINQDKIRSFKVPVPSLAEQKQIILHLDKSTSEIDDLINHANQNASLLKERRSALISAAVTGKIDVRTLVKPKDIAA